MKALNISLSLLTGMERIHKIPYRARIPGDEIRPIVEIDIENIGIILCILDSGADITTMPVAIAEKAGIDVKKRGQKSSSECAHGHQSESYEVAMKTRILGEDFYLLVNFVKDGKEPALLGRKGFFDKFEITFNESDREFMLKRKKDIST